MEASTLGNGEIKLIIAVVTTIVQNQWERSSNNNMTRLDIAHACKALRSKEDTRDLVVDRDHVRPLNM